MEHNIFRDHNDNPLGEDHVKNVENTNQDENWEIEI